MNKERIDYLVKELGGYFPKTHLTFVKGDDMALIVESVLRKRGEDGKYYNIHLKEEYSIDVMDVNVFTVGKLQNRFMDLASVKQHFYIVDPAKDVVSDEQRSGRELAMRHIDVVKKTITGDPHLDYAVEIGIMTELEAQKHKLFRDSNGHAGTDYSEKRKKAKELNYARIYNGMGMD